MSDEDSEELKMQESRKADFSPAGRKLEHKIAKLYEREINKLDLPDEKKKEFIDTIKDYLFNYELEYTRYYQTFRYYKLPSPGLS